MLRTLTTAATAATALLACAVPAAAQDAAPAGSWSFAFGAATDNRSKDASKSDGDAYVCSGQNRVIFCFVPPSLAM